MIQSRILSNISIMYNYIIIIYYSNTYEWSILIDVIYGQQ